MTKALLALYPACPICGAEPSALVGTADCTRHPMWHEPLPRTLTWRQCRGCGHLYTEHYWTEAGLEEVFRTAQDSQVSNGHTDASRQLWAPLVERVQAHMPPAWTRPTAWLDVGCGNGGLVMTAAEYGFDAVGLDGRPEPVAAIQALGYGAVQGTFETLQLDTPLQVLSMMDLLEHLPWPVQALQRAHALLADDGVLVLSMPNVECAAWKGLQAENANPYWIELEHHHHFGRRLLFDVLTACGFEPSSYGISARYKACMEVIARKAAGPRG